MRDFNQVDEKGNTSLEGWIRVTKALVQGRFDLVPELIQQELPQMKFTFLSGNNESDYLEMLQGIAGILSYRESNKKHKMRTKQLLGQISEQLEQEVVVGNSIQEKQKPIKRGPTREWALYNFTKQLRFSPVWTLLFIGDTDAWQHLHEVWDRQNDRKNDLLDPRLIFCLVQKLIDTPSVLKEIMTESEWFDIS